MTVGAIILLGNCMNGSHLRPISLDVPVALFPLIGKPIIEHQIEQLNKVKNLSHIFLIGGFNKELSQFQNFTNRMSTKYPNINFLYLEQDITKIGGSAGAIYQFGALVTNSNIENIFIINCDIAFKYNFQNMYEYYEKNMESSNNHINHTQKLCIAVTTVPNEYTHFFGVVVLSPKNDNLVVHYVEKPQTYISNTINCGVILCSLAIFDTIKQLYHTTCECKQPIINSGTPILDLFRDILPQLVVTSDCYAFNIASPFVRIKGAGSALFANQLFLEKSPYQDINVSSLIDRPNIMDGETCKMYISESAHIDSTAYLGPNVSVGDNCYVGPGVRISNAIIMDSCTIDKNSIVKFAIIGRNNVIESWCRVEGFPLSNFYATLIDSNREGLFNEKGMLISSATILGNDVRIKTTSTIYNSIVMPYKEITGCRYNEIIL